MRGATQEKKVTKPNGQQLWVGHHMCRVGRPLLPDDDSKHTHTAPAALEHFGSKIGAKSKLPDTMSGLSLIRVPRFRSALECLMKYAEYPDLTRYARRSDQIRPDHPY